MKIETQILEDHHAQLTVEIEPERLEAMKRRAAAHIARRTKIPGFRPGKAPYAVILRQVGEGAILEQAVELMVDEVYPEVIKQAEIKPYGPGELKKIAQTEPLILEFAVPLEAEVELGDYNAIRKPYEVPAISDEDVEKVLQDLREHQAIVEPVERPAQEGDLVAVKINAERLQDEEEGRSLIQDQSQEILILAAQEAGEEESESADEDRTMEVPFPGFSRNLIGMAAGEEKSFRYTYPEDYPTKSLQGIQVEFRVTVEAVKSRTLPELDDEFATSLGEYADFEALHSSVRTALEQRALESYNAGYDEEIMKEALAQATFKYPPEMLEHELDHVLSDLKRRIQRQGLEFETYLKIRQLDEEGIRKEMQPIAEERLKRELFLNGLAKAENVQVEADALEKEATETMSYLYQSMPEKEARKLSDRDVYTNIVTNIMVDMLTRQTLELFRNRCAGMAEPAPAGDSLEEPAPVEAETAAEQPVAEAQSEAEVEQTPEVSEPPVPSE